MLYFLRHKKQAAVLQPSEDLSRYGRNFMVLCSYNDYLVAVQGEVPERWINTYTKLV